MKTIAPPIADCTEYSNEIILSKTGTRRQLLENLREQLQGRYQEYRLNSLNPENINRLPLNDAQEDALKHCYTSNTQALNKLKGDMLRKLKLDNPFDVQRCPYCLARPPETWDHFLPKDHYPDFSVLAINLIYTCNSCNLKKSNRLYSNPRSVIHSYFDQLPEKSQLICNVNIQNNIPKLKYTISPQNTDYTTNILRRHFDSLNLDILYRKEGKTIVATFMDELAERYPRGLKIMRLQEEIRLRYVTIPRSHGQNNWVAATYLGLKNCDEFLECINRHIALKVEQRENAPDPWERQP